MPRTILIVDDEPGITAALMIRLQSAGHEVYHAINGLAGVEAAALHQPEVIVMDIRMPDIDGYEACQRIHALPGLSKTPVVFLSANVQEQARERAKLAGGCVFLSKPYEASDVLDAVECAAQGAYTETTHA
ncbi:MAG: response regulator [Planctomycetota bacterium]